MTKTPVQFQKNRHKIVGEVHIRGILYLLTLNVKMSGNDEVHFVKHFVKKVTK